MVMDCNDSVDMFDLFCYEFGFSGVNWCFFKKKMCLDIYFCCVNV